MEVDAPKFAIEAKLDIPIWLSKSVNKTKKDENSAAARRLRNVHGVMTQDDLRRISPQVTNGCKAHHKCVEAAAAWARATRPKVNAFMMTPTKPWTGEKDNLDHTVRRLQANKERRERDQAVCLNPDITHRGDLHKATRIFGKEETRSDMPAYRRTNMNIVPGTLDLFTDGSADKNGKADSRCGAGVWSSEPQYCKSVRVPGIPQTNNRGEIAAVVVALESAPPNQKVVIHSDSTYVINALIDGHKKWEDLGWLNVANEDLMKRALYLVRSRVAETWVQKVEAHAGILGNEEADQAAKRGLDKPDPDQIETSVPKEWAFNGARLSSLGFHDLYEWVKDLKHSEPRTRAPGIVRCVLDQMKKDTGDLYTEERPLDQPKKDPPQKGGDRLPMAGNAWKDRMRCLLCGMGRRMGGEDPLFVRCHRDPRTYPYGMRGHGVALSHMERS